MEPALKEYRCILVENEPLAIDMMIEYIGQREDLKLLKVIETINQFETVMEEAMDIDILFLDIKIKGGDLFPLLHKLAGRKLIVALITAYGSQDLSVLPQSLTHYFISKPISLNNFNKCINKIISEFGSIRTSL